MDDVQVIAHVEVSCGTAAAEPPSVADGRNGGEPLRAESLDIGGAAIRVSWENGMCVSTETHLIYGDLSAVGSMSISGGVCGLGATGSFDWGAVPVGDLFFLAVGSDGNGVEGSWGIDGYGGERGGFSASGQCGTTTKSATDSCR